VTFWEISAYLIALIIILIIFRIFSKPLKSILWLCLNSVFGWGAIMIFNYLSASFGFSLATNIVTASVCGLLGVPGFILLVILKFVFKV